MAIRDSLLGLLMIRQYNNESNSSLLDRFESKKETLFLTAGKHVLCSENVLKKKIREATSEEIDETIKNRCVLTQCCKQQEVWRHENPVEGVLENFAINPKIRLT